MEVRISIFLVVIAIFCVSRGAKIDNTNNKTNNNKTPKEDYGLIIETNDYPNENYYYENYDLNDETKSTNNTITIDSSASVDEDFAHQDYNSIYNAHADVNNEDTDGSQDIAADYDNISIKTNENSNNNNNNNKDFVPIDVPVGLDESVVFQSIFKINRTLTTAAATMSPPPVKVTTNRNNNNNRNNKNDNISDSNSDTIRTTLKEEKAKNINNYVLAIALTALAIFAVLILGLLLYLSYKCRARSSMKNAANLNSSKKNHRYLAVDQT